MRCVCQFHHTPKLTRHRLGPENGWIMPLCHQPAIPNPTTSHYSNLVRRRGLEPLPIEGPVSKTGVSAIPPAAHCIKTPSRRGIRYIKWSRNLDSNQGALASEASGNGQTSPFLEIKLVGAAGIEPARVLATRFQTETAARLRNYTPIKLLYMPDAQTKYSLLGEQTKVGLQTCEPLFH